ncbi:hypothetical protein ACVIJW_008209 [Bradyrhizobium barranii subsp. barranii]
MVELGAHVRISLLIGFDGQIPCLEIRRGEMLGIGQRRPGQKIFGAFRHVRDHFQQHHGFIEMVEIVGGKPGSRVDVGHAQPLGPGGSLGARLYMRPRGLGGL